MALGHEALRSRENPMIPLTEALQLFYSRPEIAAHHTLPALRVATLIIGGVQGADCYLRVFGLCREIKHITSQSWRVGTDQERSRNNEQWGKSSSHEHGNNYRRRFFENANK